MIKELNSPELSTFRMVNAVTVCPHFKLSFMCDYDRENGFLDYLMVHSSELHEKKNDSLSTGTITGNLFYK